VGLDSRGRSGKEGAGRRLVLLLLIGLIIAVGIPASASAALVLDPAVDYPVGESSAFETPWGIVSGDFNGDGSADLAVVVKADRSAAASLAVLINRGDGTFEPPVRYPLPARPTSVVTADLNGDGHPDIIVATEAGTQIAILMGRGDGTFEPAVKRFIGLGEWQTLAVGDFNGDGKPDLALTENYHPNFEGTPGSELAVLLGNGKGGFGKLAAIPIPGRSEGIAAVDLNGDGRDDLVLSNDADAASDGLMVLLSNGDGTFGPITEYPVPYFAGPPIVADFNHDGYEDVAVSADEEIYVFPGDGKGHLSAPIESPSPSRGAFSLAADLDLDGNLDLISSGAVQLGDGSGAFGAPQPFFSDVQPQFVTVADFNGDGVPDIATANSASDDASVLINASGEHPGEPPCAGAPIKGAGSTLQGLAQGVWVPEFTQQVCPGGPSVRYTSGIGEGGRNGWVSTFRIKSSPPAAFGAVDQAPDAADLDAFEEGVEGAHEVVIPVAQTALAIIANPPPGCSVTRITNEDLEHVFRGNFLTWNRISTATGSGCHAPIERVVRGEISNTTVQLKRYLGTVNPKVLPCSEGRTWDEILATEQVTIEEGEPQDAWPGLAEPRKNGGECKPGEGPLSPVVWSRYVGREGFDGNLAAARLAAEGEGTIGYAPLPDAEAVGAKDILEVQDNGWRPTALAQYASPSAAGDANCAGAHYKVPPQARNVAGGTGIDADWSEASAALQPAVGNGTYSLCTLTFDLALHGYGDVHDDYGTDTGPSYTEGEVVALRRYLDEYVLTPRGQEALAAAKVGFAPLPSAPFADHDVLAAARFAAGKIAY
jgi:ABC-type phosphate transport system substrate-binding protein